MFNRNFLLALGFMLISGSAWASQANTGQSPAPTFSGTVTGQNFAATGTGADTLPVGTTGQEPSGVEGMIRDNTTLHMFEGYLNGAWKQVVTATNGLVNLASQVTGTLPYTAGGTGLTTLGSNGQVLQSNGSAIVWGAGGGGSGTVSVGSAGQIAQYASNGTTVSGLTPTTAGLVTTTSGGVIGSTATIGTAYLSATGTPSSTTYLRGDNTWATPSGGGGTPGGTTGQIQYNNSGSFGGSSFITIGTSAATINGVTPTSTGSASAFLNGAGGYTTPSSGGSASVSLSLGLQNLTPRNNYMAVVGTSEAGNPNSWWEALSLVSQGQLIRTKNGAIPGSSIASNNPFDRIWQNMLAFKPGIVMFQPCRNDGGSTACLNATMRAALVARQQGALVAIATEPVNIPVLGSSPIAQLIAYNANLKTAVTALNDPGTIVIDVASAIENDSTGLPLNEAFSAVASPTGTNVLTVSSVGGTIVPGLLVIQSSIGCVVLAVSGSTVTTSCNWSTATNQTFWFLRDFQDATHPNTIGSMKMANVALSTIQAAWNLGQKKFYAPDSPTQLDNQFVNASLESVTAPVNGLAYGWFNSASQYPSSVLSVGTDSAYVSGKVQVATFPAGASYPYGLLGPTQVNLRPFRNRRIGVTMAYSATGFWLTGAGFNIGFQIYAPGNTPMPAAAPNPFLATGPTPQIYSNIGGGSGNPSFEGSHLVIYGEGIVPPNATSLTATFSIGYNGLGQGGVIETGGASQAVVEMGDVSFLDIDDPFKPFNCSGCTDVVTSNTTLDNTYETVNVTGTTTITLPAAATTPVGSVYPTTPIQNALMFANMGGNLGHVFTIVNTGTNTVTVANTGSDTINGQTNVKLVPGQTLSVKGTGVNTILGGWQPTVNMSPLYGYTIATLPATVSTGYQTFVTDQLTTCAVAGAALTSGGNAVCPVFYNGTIWVGL